MYAGKDDRGVALDAVPEDVGKPAKEDAAILPIELRIGPRILANPADGFVNRSAKLRAQTHFLPVVPIFNRHQVELGCPTK
jgi:hypothetical protein